MAVSQCVEWSFSLVFLFDVRLRLQKSEVTNKTRLRRVMGTTATVLWLLLLPISAFHSFHNFQSSVYIIHQRHKPLYKPLYSQQPQPPPEEFLKVNANAPPSASNPLSIASTLLTQNAAFLSWLTEEGGLHLAPTSTWFEPPHPAAISLDTRNVDTNESSGRGVVARVDIPMGGEVLRIPMKLCIGKKESREIFGEEVVGREMNDYVAIALLLIREKFASPDTSFYKPYIDILPPTVSSVSPTFIWSDEELETLKGSPLYPATISLKTKLRSEYQRYVVPLIQGDDRRFTEEFYSMENWEWAFTMLFSRAVRLKNHFPDNGEDISDSNSIGNNNNSNGAESTDDDEKVMMVPYADLINHSPFTRSFISSRLTPGKIFWEASNPGEDEEVIVYADRPVRKMEQVYVNYGEKSSGELMLLYGFGGGESNPFNSVDVTISISPPSKIEGEEEAEEFLKLYESKIAFLDYMNAPKTADFPVYSDRYPTEMLEYLRLMLLTMDDLKDSQNESLETIDFTKPVTRSNESRVLQTIINACTQQLDNYPTTEDEDAALISDKGMFSLLPWRVRMGIRQRRGGESTARDEIRPQ